MILILLLLQMEVAALFVCGFSTWQLPQRRRPDLNSHISRLTPSNRCSAQEPNTKLYSRSHDEFEKLTITGASVSSLGFVVVVNSTHAQREVAFPIQLTSSGTPPTVSRNMNTENNSNLTIPSLFQENIDQTSVTTPEALTFLQLINGVDLATPILPPDALSLLCVWYSFLLIKESVDDSAGVYEVEDELGLDPSTEVGPDEFYPALEYIRSFVGTMIPDSASHSKSTNFLNMTQWQRAKVRLPTVRLHGVRVDSVQTNTQTPQHREAEVETIPLKFVLECSVDNGSKVLEVPLFAIPDSYANLQSGAIALSEEVLQRLSHNFNTETSASFLALSLFHRYRKSKGARLKVSQRLLEHLVDLQRDANGGRYCWVASLNEDVSLNTIIRDSSLALFKSLYDLKESDKRVLGYLEEQNFGKSPSRANENAGPDSSSLDYNGSTSQNKIELTVEQLSMQQRLKSAWKVATEKNDTAALEKIQKAMQDFEQQLVVNAKDNKETSLQKIKRAMKESNVESVSLLDSIDEDIFRDDQ